VLEKMDQPEQVIWVDRDMKRCKPFGNARRATYVKEYELYVIDKPKIKDVKQVFEPFNRN
jgi:hypothetical protein